MKKADITDLLSFIIGTELVGVLSSILSGGNFNTFYNSLNKPAFAPFGWVFPVAWTILYALMGISAYLIYSSEHEGRRKALIVYFIQLFVNFLWSPVFFGIKSLGGAVAVIIVLVILVIYMITLFGKINKTAVILNLPYLLWILYATYLTIGFYILN